LLVTILVLIFLLYLSGGKNKKDFAELQVKKSELTDCQVLNDSNQVKKQKILRNLVECAGEKTQVIELLQKAETELAIYEIKKNLDLEQRIEKLKELPVNDCDDYVFDDASIMLWNATNNKN